MPPTAFLLWSRAPRRELFAIPNEGIVLGRELIDETTDENLSRRHARVVVDLAANRATVTDLQSRNGTFASGEPIIDRVAVVGLPAIVRTGRTVWVIAADANHDDRVKPLRELPPILQAAFDELGGGHR